jgi:hypothetical protein
MINKKFVKSRNVTKVSFEPSEIDADSIALIADFTDWQPLEVETRARPRARAKLRIPLFAFQR